MYKKLTREDEDRLELEVNKIVEQFKTEYPSVKSPIFNSFDMIEELGFFIIGKKVDNDISGFHIDIGSYKCIFVNRNHNLARQNQSLWHEVYHWYTGDKLHVSKTGEKEYLEMEFKAENFASKILIDRNKLKSKALEYRSNPRYLSRVDLVNLQNYFKASYMNIVRALHEVFLDDFNRKLYHLGHYKNQDKLISFCIENKLDYSMCTVPEKEYITHTFLEDLQLNFKENKINDTYLENVLNFIEEELNIFE